MKRWRQKLEDSHQPGDARSQQPPESGRDMGYVLLRALQKELALPTPWFWTSGLCCNYESNSLFFQATQFVANRGGHSRKQYGNPPANFSFQATNTQVVLTAFTQRGYLFTVRAAPWHSECLEAMSMKANQMEIWDNPLVDRGKKTNIYWAGLRVKCLQSLFYVTLSISLWGRHHDTPFV